MRKKILSECNFIKNEIDKCNKNVLRDTTIFVIVASMLISFSLPSLLRTIDLTYIIIGVLIIYAMPIYNYFNLYKRYKDYRNHPIYDSLKRFKNPQKICEMLQKEIKHPLFDDEFKITKNFIISESSYGFTFVPLTDICWIYHTETKHSVNFIPTGIIYHLNIVSPKHTFTYPNSREEVLKFMQYMSRITPWAVFGHTPTINNLWQNKKEKFISEIRKNIKSFGLTPVD